MVIMKSNIKKTIVIILITIVLLFGILYLLSGRVHEFFICKHCLSGINKHSYQLLYWTDNPVVICSRIEVNRTAYSKYLDKDKSCEHNNLQGPSASIEGIFGEFRACILSRPHKVFPMIDDEGDQLEKFLELKATEDGKFIDELNSFIEDHNSDTSTKWQEQFILDYSKFRKLSGDK
jgi:hypothetical protein